LRIVRQGSGPPLLLINGLGATLEMWRPLVSGLGDREVIAFDLPGAGQSGRPLLPLRMRGISGLVSDLIPRLGVERVDVLGYSLGGVVAQEVAFRSAELVRRLILASTTPGLPCLPPNPLVAMLMMSPARYYDRRLAERIVPIIAGGRTANDPGVLQAGLAHRLSHPPTPAGYLHQLWSVWGWTGHLRLPRLRTPTLVLHGASDPVVPLLNARYMAAMIPSAQLQVIPQGGHLILFDEAPRAGAAISDFLDRAAG
ncbi:MAG: alpha/beta hydrolase, partial [Solirubrobacteraceae bacterium]